LLLDVVVIFYRNEAPAAPATWPCLQKDRLPAVFQLRNGVTDQKAIEAAFGLR
jgi:hypothetical protein